MSKQAAYRVIRPSAGIVSTHRSLSGALRSIERQASGARAQGGYSEDTIEVLNGDDYRSIRADELPEIDEE